VNWLVKMNSRQYEVWSEAEYQNRLMKCEYYGARPFWLKARKLAPVKQKNAGYSPGDIIPYKKSSIGKRFAVIIELFTEAGQHKFLGIDLETKKKIVSLLA